MSVVSVELIRMMNYADDILATFRRIQASMITPEERKRLAEYMHNSNPNWSKVMDALRVDGGSQ
jgi:hypothetical protein